jgi:acetoin utilization deacetylase AcuC-like enzyme
MGFCLFNNVAIAAEYARKHHGLERIAIMDYDVHHGNGTQWAFYDRPDIFYCSTHRYPFYPGTGAEQEEGQGKGRGYTRNIPMTAGEGDLEYDTVFEKVVLPTLKNFDPDLILLSAGYDAHESDPLGGMRVTAEGFARMTAGLLQVAETCCDGKLIAVLEGGYDLRGLADSVEASLQVMLKDLIKVGEP